VNKTSATLPAPSASIIISYFLTSRSVSIQGSTETLTISGLRAMMISVGGKESLETQMDTKEIVYVIA